MGTCATFNQGNAIKEERRRPGSQPWLCPRVHSCNAGRLAPGLCSQPSSGAQQQQAAADIQHAERQPQTTNPHFPLPPLLLQSLAGNVIEAYYRLEPFLRSSVRNFVRQHLDTYAEKDDGSDKEFWISFYNLPVRLCVWLGGEGEGKSGWAPAGRGRQRGQACSRGSAAFGRNGLWGG